MQFDVRKQAWLYSFYLLEDKLGLRDQAGSLAGFHVDRE